MNFHDLDNYNLADAVKFHQRLNPRLWGRDEHLLPDVRDKLLAIASDFQEFLGVDDLNVQDITISGSNAAYSYTRHSDIDLHLVVDMPDDPVYQELFASKKYQYNTEHDIKIAGVPVELYVQPSDQKHVSQGIYSVKNGDWVQVPQRRRASIDDSCVQHKTADLDARIHSAIKSGNADAINQLWDKIKTMRQTGLEKNGEFGCENIVFKLLRNMGCIGRLKDAKTAIQDRELSLRRKPAARKKVNYGMRDYWYPGTAYAGQDHPAGTESQQVDESVDTDHLKKILHRFYTSCVDKLELENPPKLRLETTPEWSQENGSFGQYDSDTNTLILATAGRHVLDILRTMAHEMTHRQQDERNPLPIDAGETGSPWEDEANAMAGRIMRDWAEEQPEMFDGVTLEEASGYIPTKAQARDPRFVMALTRDVRPGAVGKEANKLGLKTNSQGRPALLMKTANTLVESLASELALFKEDLFEVKMTSKNLANLAKGIKGARVGLEFEMIVPNVNNDEDEEQEPDYDFDERCRSIDDAVEFFHDGDYNGRREVQRLRERMENDYQDWLMNRIDQDWNNDGEDFVRDWVSENVDDSEWRDLVSADMDEQEAFEEFVSEVYSDPNNDYYQSALDEYREEKYGDFDESDWLRAEGLGLMSNVMDAYEIQWPHWTSVGGGDFDIPTVALDFMNAMGMKSVAYSQKYHGPYYKWINDNWVNIGNEKPDDCFTVEPDGSLVPDNSGERGLEFVSHPIPLEDIGTVMSKVQNWASIYGAYTDKDNKTSIHTNISVPGYDLDKLDYLKAALLLGDEYVLREFDRFGNTYAAPAIEKVKQLVKQNPQKAKELLDKMKSQLNAKASKLIHSGQTDKFTSINTKDDRIEFRAPGGDYLSIIADNPQKMIDTINRMVVTMDAAVDPSKYKEEYQKKLYDMLTGNTAGRDPETGEIEWNIDAKASVWYKDERTVNGKKVFTPKQRSAFSTTVTASTVDAAWKKAQEQNPTELSGAKKSDYLIEPKRKSQSNNEDLLKIFSQYSAGKMPKAALRSFVKQAQLKRQIARDPTGGQLYWWRVYKDGKGARNGAMIEVVARTKAEAIDLAGREWGFFSREYRNIMDAEPVRPYDQSPAKARVGEPQPLGPQRDYEIFNLANSTVVERFRASSNEEALEYFDRIIAPGDQLFYDVRLAPAAPQQTYVINNGSYNTSSIRSSSTEDAIQQFRERISNESNPSTYSLISADNQVVARGGDQGTGTHTYRAFDLRNNQTLGTFQGGEPGSDSAAEAFADMLAREGISAQYADYELLGQERRPNRPNVGSQTDMENRLGWPDQTGDANYEIVDRRTQQPVFVFIANTEADAANKYQQWLAAAGYSSDPQELAWRRREATQATPQQSSGEFTGHWLILDPQGRTIHRFSGVGNVQSDANRVAINWMRSNPGRMQAGVTVVPEMGEAASQYTSTPIPGVEEVELDIPLAQTQWEVYNRSSNQPVFVIQAANQTEAWRKGQEWVATAMQANPEVDASNFSVRPRAQSVSENITVLEQRLRRDLDALGNQEPTGPETPPKMPAGTIKVDVSDTQDWYQLGQDISNLKLANKAHYNQGPPHTVLAFGSEELENKYSHELKNLGLPTHDLDEPGEEDMDESREITKFGKLDNVLKKCINMIHRGHESDPEKYGRVAACLIDNKNNHTYGINLPGPDGTRRHAERVAIDNHLKRHGRIGPNAIMVTTLSPCVHDMDERHGESCTDLLTDYGIEKCYAGWQDPTQHPVTDYPFNLQVTNNADIFNSCRDIAASFLQGAMVEGNFTRLQNKESPAMRFNEFKLTENSKVTIKRVQQLLLDLGYNLGPTGVDGIVGPYTQSAIDAYMSKAGPQGQVVPKKDKPSTIPVAPKKDKPSTIPVAPKKDKPSTIPVAPKKDKPSTSSTMPVNGRLTSPFGNRKPPVPGATTNHPGVDIAVPTGTPVRSPIAGKVEYASMDNNACGGTIAISNGREKHRFCHCSKIDVTVGQVIQQGDVVGLTGGGARDPGRGLSTGPHLHWEKYIAGNLVDPMSNIG